MCSSGPIEDTGQKLPFDIFAVLLGIRRKVKWIVLTVFLAVIAGIAAGKYFGKRSWDSYCVMLYQPPSVELSGRVYEAPAVQTQLNLVKLRDNLEALRERLELASTVESLSSACDVTNPRDTQLLVIKGTSDSAMMSAAIANTLAEVFVENQRRVRNGELADAKAYLQGRKEDLTTKLRRAQEEDGEVAAKDPEDVQREIRSYQTKIDALDVIYEKALSERRSLEIQVERVSAIMEEVKQKIADEKNEAAAVQGLSNLNIRVERIREAIMDQRAEDTNDITLTQWKNRLDFDKQLLDKGYLSQAVYDHELAQFEKLKAQAVDSEQIAAWKEELDELYTQIRPSENKETASAPILRDLMLRSFNLELQLKGTNENIAKTKESRDSMSAGLEQLLASRNSGGTERWQVQSWRDELSDVDKSIAMVSSLENADASDFQIVSPAEASPHPSSSNRRVLAIAATGMVFCLGVSLVLASELVQLRVRTTGEVSLLMDEPVLAAISHQDDSNQQLLLAARDVEQIRRATRSIMAAIRGTRILVLGCQHGDGCSTMAQQIGACLARQQRDVTILDSDLRSPESGLSEHFNIEPDRIGLAELMADRNADVEPCIVTTQTPNLKFVPRGTAAYQPDLLGSDRMRDVIDRLASDSDFLILDGPPICDSTDAEYLASHVDAVLLVIRSRSCSRSTLKTVAARIRETDTPLLGVLLNDIDPAYLQHS